MTNTETDPRMELFNLKEDEGEQKNVAKQYPELVSELRSLMDAAHSPSAHPHFRLASER